MDYVNGMWFKTEVDAEKWMDFEASDETVDAAAYAQFDHFNEWRQWRDEWLKREVCTQDFEAALDAIEDIMSMDKGPNEDEWIEWCNRLLPLVQRHGRMKNTVGFG